MAAAIQLLMTTTEPADRPTLMHTPGPACASSGSAVIKQLGVLFPLTQTLSPGAEYYPRIQRHSGQSQRDCVTQPRVARHELPWEERAKSASTPTGLHLPDRVADATPLAEIFRDEIIRQLLAIGLGPFR